MILETAVGWARQCRDLGARQDETTRRAPARKEEQRRMARPERGAGGCITLSPIRWTPSKPSTIAFMRLGKRN